MIRQKKKEFEKRVFEAEVDTMIIFLCPFDVFKREYLEDR